MNLSQTSMPIYEAMLRHKANRVVPYDVPGHKGGRGTPVLTNFLGKQCLENDVNSMKPLDSLCHPTGVIHDAQCLAAEAFGAAAAFFMVGGTTQSVQSMIMSCCKSGEKIIMPRNVHRSAINALVLCGAEPVYVNPGINKKFGIPLGMSVASVKEAIVQHPDAKAVLINNPTYYGVCSDVKAIAGLAHSNNMLLLADEAHGTHFYFGEDMPAAGMRAGADMCAVSVHKTGGSLTQSSMLFTSGAVSADHVRQIINLTQTTSGSYLLLSSLDIARNNLYLNGKAIFKKTIDLARYAREEINKIGGYDAFSKELINNTDIFDFDETKLSIYTRDIGLAGIEVLDILRDEYGIQIELGDLANILAIVSAGDREFEIERLISSLSEIKRLYSKDKTGMIEYEYINPVLRLNPQKAFFSEKKSIPLKESAGHISGEFVMSYPPGIPILAPGELITPEILDYTFYAKEKGCLMMGTLDMTMERIMVTV